MSESATTMEMRGLSLTQPWASLVAIGAKAVETRSWPTKYRGPVAIHAATRFPKECKLLSAGGRILDALLAGGFQTINDLPLGRVVAVGEIVECYQTEAISHTLSDNERAFGDYTPGRYAFFIERIRRLWTPVPCLGKLGLWTVDRCLLESIDIALRKPDKTASTGAK